jgi:adenine-specific DNA methylase
MNRYRPDVSYPTNVLGGIFYMPQIMEETVPWGHFENKCERLFKGYNAVAEHLQTTRLMITTQSACDMGAIADCAADYIFTDPPYAEKIQYGELNFIWEAWLGLNTSWHSEEIIVNDVRKKTEVEWASMMTRAMSECFRILKPGRWLSLCYHDTSEGTWSLVQHIMRDVGFVVDESCVALSIDTGSTTYNQSQADKVTKRDLVINFRKPTAGERRPKVVITGEEDQQNFRQKAQAVIREFLQNSPGSTKDRIYDSVVSRLVRKGQMEAHDFDELLREVAEEVKEPVKKTLFENEEPDLLGSHLMGRWHLKESEAGGEEAERATADSAGTRIHDFLVETTTAKLAESDARISEL